MSRFLLSKWWPDQVAAAVLLLSASLLMWAGPSYFDGTGVGAKFDDVTTYAWLCTVAASSLSVIVTTELDHPRCTAVALFWLGSSLALNAALVGGAKGPGAGMAAGVYAVACIYLFERARLSIQLAKVRRPAR